ncbi:proto-oncogene tyrosine-protein kinase ROS [Copidosoma floridanum]|uniref:proto-oncogene tyrosine-protein kinase ROS n=1 Tax=Copidosoma floridanum TaxID=29053 RepID=UPI0006C95528|nr:proto-oncogene tyrosine-protein kinase ROS [Copidosoma floridanum]
MRHAASANRVAFDWIARKIYWADEKKRIVLRSHLDGSHREPVAIVGVVQRLLIDSLEAHLYWSTSRTVEVVRLNGEDRRQYRSEDDFDGRRVSGLTLDLDNRYVYWIVGDTEDDFKLYRSLTADNLPTDQDILPEVVSTIRNTIGNSLSYVSDRFFFLDSTRSALTTDAHGKFTATISNISDHSSLLSLFVRGPLPSVPKNLTPIAVRPGKVNASSIAIVGTWRDFSVTWQPVTGPNYGRIFYEVSFTDYINVNTQPVTTSRTTLGYANADQLLPYSLLEVTIRAYTYWDAAPRVSRVLRSPQSVPSQPADPRVFVESFKDPLAESVDYFATFRWGMPEFGNGPVLGFTIQCWILVDGAEVLICDSVNVTVSELEYKVHNLRAATAYYFQVRAFAEVGAGPFTDTVSASTENENPVPQLLVATMEDVKKIDLDERSNLTITRHIAVEVANLAAEAKIFWINEMQELVTADADGRSITKILTLNNTALSLCADWISRSVFWTESDMESGLSHVMKLDITVWEAGDYEYSRILTRNRRIVNLDIAPLTGNLFWFELSTSSLGFVMQSDLDGENVQPFFNHTEDCSCPFKPMIQPVFTIDNTDPSSPVVYWISDEGQLFIADIEGCICSLVVQPGPDRGLPPTSLTTDKRYIYWSNRDTGKIHYTDKNGFGDSMTIKDYLINDTRSIRAIGKSLQPYPEPDCLIPQRAQYNVQQVSRSSSSITVRLPEAQAYLGCEKYKLPATKYIIDVAECDRLEDPQNERLCENGTKHQTYTREFEVRGLKPFTKYRFRLTLTNYYSDQEFAEIDQYGAGLLLKTDVGVPSSPENLEVRALTPNLASVEWSPPELWNADFVRYKVFWRSANGTLLGEKPVKDGDASTYLQPLTPGQKYAVHVRAYPENYTDMFSRSDEKILNMHPEPNDLTLSGVSSVAINVTWLPARDLLADYALEFAEGDSDTWRTVDRAAQVSGRLVYQVSNLLSKKLYKFRLILKYRGSTINYVWPNDDRFTFQTLEDIPTAPGVPLLVKSQNSNHRIRWEPAKSLHSKNLFYHLQGRTIDADDLGNVTNEWITLYNGTDDFWDVPRNMRQKYVFRTRAWNDYGFGNWSETSPVVDLSEMTRALMIAQEHLGLILGVGVAILTLVLFCVFLCPLNKKSKEEQQQKLKKKKKAPIKLKPHVELATLREIPRGNFVEANSLYVAAVETDASDSLSPKIQREQISLAKFLGKGAFGEVFQGVVKDIQGPGSTTPIAVKTLRKGASTQEKNEFLQEAKLMSQFQHKHVLRLLGVCLDTDPPLMLLELMAGGDLLSYLRNSRSLKPTDPSALRLQDLLSMCEDVARGCRYLEELHFVHRDLACRNCLVSARDRDNRVVKIGDFGLARDIYKNDYYRKEGEGLLPVRWMAPESLVDGVFTSQSDVWAFGVLMWEITSLGQQPYQARTNIEVLHHVRAGGRLPKPLNCPIRLHQLMLKCWSSVDARPSFKDCLEYILLLRNSTEDAVLSPVNQFHVNGNPYNRSSHFRANLSMQPLFQDSSDDTSKPTIGPKYSWLLDDEEDDSKDPRAAYEIPKSIPVAVQSATIDNNNDPNDTGRYIDIYTEEGNDKGVLDDGASDQKSDIDSRTAHEDEEEEGWMDNRKPSSMASLGDSRSLKQLGSYAKLVGNGESVSSLSDWRRMKKIASDRRERTINDAEETRSNASTIVSYSTISFTQGSASLPRARLQRSKSSLQGARANIPLVINSGLLNILRQETEGLDEGDSDEVSYANVDSDTDKVTDL